nr:TMEM175 family protein [Propionicimonas sp.]
MKTTRLEAFSDGVLAIIITIMVLELRAPEGPELHDLLGAATGLLTYLLSFVYVGIYWNNHHHMFQLVGRVTGGILWSNLALLFCLSLLPFTTAWMDEQQFAPVPVITYGVNLLACAVAYWTLQTRITRVQGAGGPLATALGRDVKAKLSPAVYVAGILGTLLTPWLGVAIYAVVALMWLVPDRRVERYIAAHGVDESSCVPPTAHDERG